MKAPEVLVSTIVPISGGVPQMTRFVLETLAERGYKPVVAHYQPYSLSPDLSVPFFKLGTRKPDASVDQAFDGIECHAIGCWLPELEWTNYQPGRHWRQLIEHCDYHVTVSGNALSAAAQYRSGKPFWAWVATPWLEDRVDRVKTFSAARRLFDSIAVKPFARRLEKNILRTGTIVPLSEYTKQSFQSLCPDVDMSFVMPMSIDHGVFKPRPDYELTGNIGFVGRFDDPRKNISLLLGAAALCKQRGTELNVLLIGGEITGAIQSEVEALGLAQNVIARHHLPREELVEWYQKMDVFVLPSYQEGLCIAALEAMACGVPVISTRCGGPEEFIQHGENGMLVSSDADSVANAISQVLQNNNVRQRYSDQAVQTIKSHYTTKRVKQIFWDSFEHTFDRLP